jgi:hypothetical protein
MGLAAAVPEGTPDQRWCETLRLVAHSRSSGYDGLCTVLVGEVRVLNEGVEMARYQPVSYPVHLAGLIATWLAGLLAM